jgi:hypothetical protein
MRAHSIHVLSPFSPELCKRRLEDVMEPEVYPYASMNDSLGTAPVFGRIDGLGLSLRKNHILNHPLQTVYSATMIPTSSGTEIVGIMVLRPLRTASYFVVWLWLTGLILFNVILFLSSLCALIFDQEVARPKIWKSLVIPLLFLALGCGLLGLGHYFSWRDARYLQKFLIDTLGAKPID